MIEYINGPLVEKKTNYCVIDVNGMGYNIIISLNTFNNLPDINEKIKILTYFSVSENNQSLFGFYDKGEKELFLLLIGVSGIGPKTAINMLSAVPPKEFKNRLIAGEVKMLTSLPGIGPKTARRIIVELKDKFIDSGKEELPIEEDNSNTDAFYALRSLGFKSNDIRRVVNKVLKENRDLKTELVIKESLKLLR
tara:strand:- start:647 stop:1228 length:582 start_codon:yes stop_codon:yes gene_type:complete